MKRCFWLLLLLVVLSGAVYAAGDRDCLYQVSTIDALMAGLYDGGMTLGELKKHGDTGIGTFDALDGEMVVLDGKVYQIKSDGSVSQPSDSVTTPFAAVTLFDDDQTDYPFIAMTMTGLTKYLDTLAPSPNLFYAFRIDGDFKSVKTRSVPAQSKPYPKLIDVVAKQPVFEFEDVKGTIIGLRCPYYVKGVNVPGYHFHFINADRSRGGHLLDCVMVKGTVVVDETTSMQLVLPDSKEFRETRLDGATESDLHKVEKDTK